MRIFTIKAKLPTTEDTFYTSVDEQEQGQRAVNINFCNLTGTTAKVSLSFTPKGGTFSNGAIVFEKQVLANDNLVINERWINPDDEIRAYCDTADAVVMSIDIEGIYGDNIYPTV